MVPLDRFFCAAISSSQKKKLAWKWVIRRHQKHLKNLLSRENLFFWWFRQMSLSWENRDNDFPSPYFVCLNQPQKNKNGDKKRIGWISVGRSNAARASKSRLLSKCLERDQSVPHVHVRGGTSFQFEQYAVRHGGFGEGRRIRDRSR